MTNPDQTRHDEHDRSGGGVRGAINDLLGRGDRTDDDRHVQEQHLDQERSASVHDAGLADPAGRPADDGYGVSHGSSAATVGAAAPQGERFDDQAGATVPGGARHTDVGPDGPGYERHALGDPQPGASTQAQYQDTGYQDTVQTDSAHQDTDRQDLGHSGTEQGYVGQPDVDHQQPGSAGARTVDIGGPDADVATAPAGVTERNDTHLGNGGGALNGGATTAAPAGHDIATTSQGEDSEGRERLVSADRAESYGSRWDKVKGEFVDEPRQAVADADALVGELLDELQSLFSEQRQGIERSLDADETSTEDMRLALRRYRSFFDRLLSI